MLGRDHGAPEHKESIVRPALGVATKDPDRLIGGGPLRRRSAGGGGRGSSGARSHRAVGGDRRTARAGDGPRSRRHAPIPPLTTARGSRRCRTARRPGRRPTRGRSTAPRTAPRPSRPRSCPGCRRRTADALGRHSAARAGWPVSRRSIGRSSATWRRQNPCLRSSSARKPMSSPRSLMIASRVARSDLARTAHTGQPPRRIASRRRISTMSRAPGPSRSGALTTPPGARSGWRRSPPGPRHAPGPRRA